MHARTNSPQAGVDSQGPGPAATNGSKDGAYASGMSREFKNFLADVEDLIEATTSLTGDELTHARARLNARVSEARDSVEALGVAVDQRARRSVSATNEYVHEQPWKAIGIGTAFGLLLGFVLSRRG